ncbi:MAG: hypothetical protein ACUVS1_04405 [Actinomycetota bacterium]
MFSRKWSIAALAALASLGVLILLLVGGPGRGRDDSMDDEPRAEARGEERASEVKLEEPGTRNGPAQRGDFSVEMGGNGGSPAVVFTLPDPLSWDAVPPPGGEGGICGRWVLEMEGKPLVLENCHLLLREDGTLLLPPDYGGILELREGSYAWDPGNGGFRAQVDLVVKGVSGYGQVPVRVVLEGTVAGSLAEIAGSYQAQPAGDTNTSYAQQGCFLMRR